jgi:hypothetical protein
MHFARDFGERVPFLLGQIGTFVGLEDAQASIRDAAGAGWRPKLPAHAAGSQPRSAHQGNHYTVPGLSASSGPASRLPGTASRRTTKALEELRGSNRALTASHGALTQRPSRLQAMRFLALAAGWLTILVLVMPKGFLARTPFQR